MRFVFCRLPAFLLPAGVFVLLFACNDPRAPLDANTRQRIDSVSTTQMRLTKQRIDSLCLLREKTELPRLVDSFRQIRMQEIEAQLKTVPR